ncbi:hypothetical protein IID23_01850 [Patescibacteria group bacterium]|nr:hypothetical protein [Patescibacteria group bacterium]
MPEDIPQVQVTTSNKTSWKKIILTVLIIIVVSGLIVGAYWFFVLNKDSDTSDLTGPVPKPNVPTATKSATPSTKITETKQYCSNGKEHTYKNVFKICLPKDFKHFKFSDSKNWVMYSNAAIPEASEVYGFLVVEFADKNSENEPTLHSKENEKKVLVDEIEATQILGKIYLAGVPTPEIPNPPEGTVIRTIFSKSGQTYEIFVIAGDVDEIRAYDQLIESFKFLD